MGHSSINVSLTYLRGLEVAELKEEDMLMVSTIYQPSFSYINLMTQYQYHQ